MKKKIVSGIFSFVLVLGLTITSVNKTKASAEVPIIDGSYLTQDSESIGYIIKKTRVDDLLNGYAKIVRMGPETIYAGGTTMANHAVETIGIAVMIERVEKDGNPWEFVDGWIQKKVNSDRVSANRQLTVDGNYYYRVRCVHSANKDVGDSFTNGIYVEKKSGILSTTN